MCGAKCRHVKEGIEEARQENYCEKVTLVRRTMDVAEVRSDWAAHQHKSNVCYRGEVRSDCATHQHKFREKIPVEQKYKTLKYFGVV